MNPRAAQRVCKYPMRSARYGRFLAFPQRAFVGWIVVRTKPPACGEELAENGATRNRLLPDSLGDLAQRHGQPAGASLRLH